MSRLKRALSVLLLAMGVILVFAGFTKAVGFTTVGILSSTLAVAALLYSGAVWFGARPADPPRPEKSSHAERP